MSASSDLAAHIGVLPPMPRAASRVLELLSEPDTSAEQIGRVIETDPALTAAVLRLVNSALFSLRQPVTSISQALVLMGFLRLRSLTLTTVTAGLRDLVPQSAADARDAIWEHSVNVALGGRALADQMGFSWTEEAFVGGLLHDVGRIVLLARKSSDYQQMCALTRDGLLPTLDQERDTLGLDHVEVGTELMRYWKMPPQLVDVIGGHHGETKPRGETAELVAIVTLADRLLGSASDEDTAGPARFLGLTPEKLFKFAQDIPAEVAEARASLLAI